MSNKLANTSADPNVKVSHVPALIQAAEKGQIELVRLLLDAGADPYITDSFHEDEGWEGYTALDRAQMKGHSNIVQLLRQAGGKRLDACS
jgi:ankyrin repeat protein